MDKVYGYKTSIAIDDGFLKDWDWNLNTVFDTLTTKTVFEDSKVTIQIVLPGVKKEDLEFKFERNILTITHNGESDFIDKFSKTIDLKDYDFNTLKRDLVNGVLILELEKNSEAKPVIFKLE